MKTREKRDMILYSKWVPCVVKGMDKDVSLSSDLSVVTEALENLGVYYETKERRAFFKGVYAPQWAVYAEQQGLVRRGIDLWKWMQGVDNGD